LSEETLELGLLNLKHFGCDVVLNKSIKT
jgi:hypothetical protein